MKDIVFVMVDVSLGQQRFEGIIDAKARELVARDTKVEDSAPHEKKAARWMEKWKTEKISDRRGRENRSCPENLGKLWKKNSRDLFFGGSATLHHRSF